MFTSDFCFERICVLGDGPHAIQLRLTTMNRWGFVTGGWKDVIAGYSNFCDLLDRRGEAKGNLIVYTNNRDHSRLMKEQDRVLEVKTWLIEDMNRYDSYLEYSKISFNEFKRLTGLNDLCKSVLECHVTRYNMLQEHYSPPASFSMKVVGGSPWATGFSSPFLLVQPYSFSGVPEEQHWQYWLDAIEWLLNVSDIEIVLVGHNYPEKLHSRFASIRNEKLINLIGETESMLDVYGLAKQSVGIITTANSLSMMSIALGKPAITVLPVLFRLLGRYYYNWINRQPNVVLENDIDLRSFMNICENWLSDLRTSKEVFA